MFANVKTDDDAICLNCGLQLNRSARTVDPVVPVQNASSPTSRRGRGRSKRRAKKAAAQLGQATDTETWLDQLAAPQQPVLLLGQAGVAPSPTVTSATHLSLAYDASVSDATAAPHPVVVAPPATADVEDVDDATVVAPGAVSWELHFEGGLRLVLPGDDVVIGRRPVLLDDATPLMVPDPEKTLSRTHARLRRDITSNAWWIEDLDSANGVVLVDDIGRETVVSPRHVVSATSVMLLGTLRVSLVRNVATQHDSKVAAS